jgi:tetratricopeptide (TPR) repeat protein
MRARQAGAAGTDATRVSWRGMMDEQTQERGAASATDTAARRQAEAVVALAEEAEPALEGPDQVAWLDRLEGEYDRIAQALDWSSGGAAPGADATVIGLRIAGALKIFWEEHRHLDAGRAWLARLLPAAQTEGIPCPADVLAKAVDTAARLAYKQGDLPAAHALYTESLARQRALRSPVGISRALVGLGHLARMGHDPATARAYYEEAYALRRKAGDQWGMAGTLYVLGKVAVEQGDVEQAARFSEESLAICQAIGDSSGVAYAHEALGLIAFVRGDVAGAVAHTTAAVDGYRELGNAANVADALDGLGWLTAHAGDYARAAALLQEAVALVEEAEGGPADAAWPLCHLGIVVGRQGDLGRGKALLAQCLTLLRAVPDPDPAIAGMGLLGLAGIAGAQGQPARLAQLTAAAERLYETVSPIDQAFARDEFARCRTTIDAQLGAGAQAAAREAGRARSLEQAMAYALEEFSAA